MERDAGKRLTGRVEMDDAYLGGERSGGKRGRGAPGKTPIIAAVETTPEGQPVRLKLRRVNGFRRKEVEKLARRSLDPTSTVVSDGLGCFRGVADAGCTHQPIRTGSGRKAVLTPAFKWVNTALGNIKTAITATYRAIRQKHVPRYLAEFEYRFNRRYDLAAMMPRLGWAAVRTPPMPIPPPQTRLLTAELARAVPLAADRERCRALLANVEFVQFLAAPPGSPFRSPLFRFMAWLIVSALPVAVFLAVQISFLRYQSVAITTLHQVCLALDLAALSWFHTRVWLAGQGRKISIAALHARMAAINFILPMVVLAFAVVYAGVPSAEENDGRRQALCDRETEKHR